MLTTGSGGLTLADSLAHQDTLSEDADFSREFSQLIGFGPCHGSSVWCRGYPAARKDHGVSPESRRAILVNNDLKFGLARMFETFRELLGETGVRVFRNLNDALAWVLDRNTGGWPSRTESSVLRQNT